ncbi:MAG: site-2 protease family protein [Ignavibacteriales bacterium]|nr:site-2 protease family protein [Ignavibacteriales bacterium]
MKLSYLTMLYSLPGVILGLTIHEYMHAYAAYRLGDTTARDQGRLTLNPLKHIDLLGFFFLIVAGFGWAKPVSFTRANLQYPKRDEAIIAAAGPASNLMLALAVSVLLRLILLIFPFDGNAIYGTFLNVLIYCTYINYGLFVFNLIPIPPLDGSHLLFSTLQLSPETEAKFYRYGTFALFGIIFFESRSGIDILPVGKLVRAMADGVFQLLGF